MFHKRYKGDNMAFPKLLSRSDPVDNPTGDPTSITTPVLSTRTEPLLPKPMPSDSTGDEKLDTLANLLRAQLRDSNIAPSALQAIRFSRSREGYDPRQVDETMETMERASAQIIESVTTFITYVTMSIVALRTNVGSSVPSQSPLPVTQPPSPPEQPASSKSDEALEVGTTWSATEIAETLLTAQRMANALETEAREQAADIISEAQRQAVKIVSDAQSQEREIRQTIETLTVTVHELEESSSHWEDILSQHIAELDSAYDTFMTETHRRLIGSIATNVNVQPSLSAAQANVKDQD